MLLLTSLREVSFYFTFDKIFNSKFTCFNGKSPRMSSLPICFEFLFRLFFGLSNINFSMKNIRCTFHFDAHWISDLQPFSCQLIFTRKKRRKFCSFFTYSIARHQYVSFSLEWIEKDVYWFGCVCVFFLHFRGKIDRLLDWWQYVNCLQHHSTQKFIHAEAKRSIIIII